MGLYERLMEANKRKGIVSRLETMHHKHAVCEVCGKEIKVYPKYGHDDIEPYTGRWLSEGEAAAWEKSPDVPVYSHVVCPVEEW